MEVTSTSTQLGCGRDIDEVWENIGGPPDAHELTCEFCQAARSDLSNLVTATRTLREDDLASADQQASPETIDKILAIARSEVRRGRRLPLDRPRSDQPDELTISEQALVSVVRRIGDETGLIEIRRCAVSLPVSTTDPAGANLSAGSRSDDGEPADVAVSLRVTIAADAPIPAVIDNLREVIIEVVGQEVGMNVVRVDVAVEDLTHA